MDVIKGHNETSVRLFSNRVAESDSVEEEGHGVHSTCSLVHTEGPASDQVRSVFQFEYTNPTTESLTNGTAVTMKLDGEMTLKYGYDYFLTSTHLCWTAAEADMHSYWPSHRPHGQRGCRPRARGQWLAARRRRGLGADGHIVAARRGRMRQWAAPAASARWSRSLAPRPTRPRGWAWRASAPTRSFPDGVDERRAVVEVGTELRFQLYRVRARLLAV